MPLATGHLQRPAFAQAGELHEIECLRGPLRDFLRRYAAHPEAERHIVGGAQMREQRVILEYDADIAPERRQIDDGFAPQIDLARRRLKKSGDETECRGLATARRSKQRYQFAFVHIEIDTRDRHRRPVVLLDPDETQRRLSHVGDLRR